MTALWGLHAFRSTGSKLKAAYGNRYKFIVLRMSLMHSLRRLVPMRWQRTGKSEPLSMVLLLRTPYLFNVEELRLAAERAWHTSFSGRDEKSMHCVVQNGTTTLMKAGPHLVSFFYYPQPFLENPELNVDWLPRPSQRQAWIEHTSCLGVDYLNHGVSVELGYCVLAQLVAEMLDGNCTGVYIPRERVLSPNDKSLHLELHKFAAACESGVKEKS